MLCSLTLSCFIFCLLLFCFFAYCFLFALLYIVSLSMCCCVVAHCVVAPRFSLCVVLLRLSSLSMFVTLRAVTLSVFVLLRAITLSVLFLFVSLSVYFALIVVSTEREVGNRISWCVLFPFLVHLILFSWSIVLQFSGRKFVEKNSIVLIKVLVNKYKNFRVIILSLSCSSYLGTVSLSCSFCSGIVFHFLLVICL